jgi:N-acetylmuramoyl-L-alanine amidase
MEVPKPSLRPAASLPRTRIAAVGLLLTLASLAGFGQTTAFPQKPAAPIVRSAAKPATPKPSTSIQGPILTQSFPVPSKKPTPSATSPQKAAAKSTPKPSTRPPTKPSPNAATSAASANTAPINRTLILLDPAHGGVDSGSRIGDSILEKDVTLALAFKLRALLTARGFNVVMTRDSGDATLNGAPLTLDDRAGIANHAHAAACLLLHATGSGTGVHLYSSELAPIDPQPQVLPWLTAQASWVPQSQRLESQLATAFSRAHIPLVSSSASVRPVDSLTCPALIVELAPRTADASTINDSAYQQAIAQTIATSLVFWQNLVRPPHLSTPSGDASTDSKAAQP